MRTRGVFDDAYPEWGSCKYCWVRVLSEHKDPIPCVCSNA